MDNQHKKIKGYRDLSKQEVDLMNRIKEHAEKTGNLLNEVKAIRDDQWAAYHNKLGSTVSGLTEHDILESQRCLSIAKQNLQQGQMWFVRAVALPQSF